MKDIKALFSSLNLNITNVTVVHGGDINTSYCIDTTEGKFFIKVNDASKYPALFQKEANGLKTLVSSSTFKIPEIMGCGIADSLQYLLLEWIDPGNAVSSTWYDFSTKLAQMHRQPQQAFGFTEDNYFGTYLQINTETETWSQFYSRHRIMPMIKLLYDQGKIKANVITAAENFCSLLDVILPAEPPALLHGDLWSGNYLIAATGEPVLIDPAVYCGHREMDIGMSKLFGGFTKEFYNSYNEAYPLVNGWEERLPYAQLYPLLFHAYAFGGSYVDRVASILSSF